MQIKDPTIQLKDCTNFSHHCMVVWSVSIFFPVCILNLNVCFSQSRGSRAVFQFYPENSSQVELITAQAMKAGFTGGLVVDYPNSTKAKKFFLCLMTGGQQPLPAALGVDSREEVPNQVAFSQKRFFIHFFKAITHLHYLSNFVCRDRMKQLRNGKAPKKSRDWILEKKERRRRQGKETRDDSKFTGRKRPTHVW